MPCRALVVIALLSIAVYTAPAQTRGAQAPVKAAPLVIGETFTIASKTLHETRRINVYLPAAYTPGSRLPVLYMPDGGMQEDFLHVAGLVQVSTGNETMRPFILVGIENTERRRDMTGPTRVAKDSTIAPHVGGSAAFRRFIRTELMPQIKSRYRTTNETGVVGESLAGLFVVETLLLEPDLFDSYLAFDPSLWWNDHRLVADADRLLREHSLAGKTLFLSNSSEPELATTTKQFAETLEKGRYAGLVWHYRPLPDETHGTIYHPAALMAFREVFKPAPAKKD